MIKLLLIGDGGVGKSTFREVWLGGKFRTQYLMTLGADFAAKEIIFQHSDYEEFKLKFQIWDLAGQPRFKVVGELYYRGAVGALCFFDITNQESFLNLKEWINHFWKLNGKGVRPLLIVGTKSDLRNESSNQIATEAGIKYAKELTQIVQQDHGFTIHYIETSAKENVNVDQTFQLIAKEIINSLKFQTKSEKSILKQKVLK
jgi:small GTP-binding protein